MHEIVVEPTLQQQLAGLPGTAIVRDADGRILGLYSPIAGNPRPEDLQLDPSLSIAETELLRHHQTGKPLEEILSRLGVK